jgi:hypothetical protein
VAWILVTAADWIDWEFFYKAFPSMRNITYQSIDKTLDFYSYCFAFLFAVGSHRFGEAGSPFFNIFLVLFFWRLVGLIIFLLKKNRKILMFFPNIFEMFFWFYVLSLTFPSLGTFLEGNRLWATLLLLGVIKIIWEYLLHVSDFFHRLHLRIVGEEMPE